MESNMLDKFLTAVTKVLNVIGGSALTFMMFLTVADVLMRAGGRPILGTYEIVGLALAIVIGFGIPSVSMDRSHVYMEFLLDKMPGNWRQIFNTFTRLLCIFLFIIIGYNLFSVGNEFHTSGEVSPTLELPFFPVAYGVGVCCFIEVLVFVNDIIKIWRGQYE
ncbi:MAG: TRAP transporter small permease [Syntrophobacterales bacterium]|jgi:TRAP-type C4-dicarboxylate transport system permease small subunit|nr:TRAP transporter small permease [Syntrophobacterales bacterium]